MGGRGRGGGGIGGGDVERTMLGDGASIGGIGAKSVYLPSLWLPPPHNKFSKRMLRTDASGWLVVRLAGHPPPEVKKATLATKTNRDGAKQR